MRLYKTHKTKHTYTGQSYRNQRYLLRGSIFFTFNLCAKFSSLVSLQLFLSEWAYVIFVYCRIGRLRIVNSKSYKDWALWYICKYGTTLFLKGLEKARNPSGEEAFKSGNRNRTSRIRWRWRKTWTGMCGFEVWFESFPTEGVILSPHFRVVRIWKLGSERRQLWRGWWCHGILLAGTISTARSQWYGQDCS